MGAADARLQWKLISFIPKWLRVQNHGFMFSQVRLHLAKRTSNWFQFCIAMLWGRGNFHVWWEIEFFFYFLYAQEVWFLVNSDTFNKKIQEIIYGRVWCQGAKSTQPWAWKWWWLENEVYNLKHITTFTKITIFMGNCAHLIVLD